MAASFCPSCAHCRALKEIEKAAERQRDLEEEIEERRRKMDEEVAAQKKRLMEEGVIYGDNFEAYSVAEKMKIKNLDFMYKMYDKAWPNRQPPTQEEYDERAERCEAIGTRLNELLIENL